MHMDVLARGNERRGLSQRLASLLVLGLVALACLLAQPQFGLAAAQGGEGSEQPGGGQTGGGLETTTIGRVTRVLGTSFLVRGGTMRDVVLNAPVMRGESLRTGPQARVELTMLDETKLTLGADTVFDLERYDLGSQRGAGSVLLRLTKGVFRAATGKLDALRGGPFEVATPLGTVGIHGTDFWGGYLGGDEISVLLVTGKGVYIKNDVGTTDIVTPGQGITLKPSTRAFPAAPPPAASMWGPEKTSRAFKSVSFD